MSDSRWYFTEEQLANSPSRKCGINAEQELSLRQRASNLIQDMGQRLQVSQLCINTAIVYMHRFYAFHSFTLFHRNSIAAAAFFLAAKVEEQPRKLEHVIKILNICLDRVDNARESYAEQAQELVFNENVLLQTLGFDVAIDHPHTHVVRACNLFNIVTVSRELRQTCYFMASNSLHLTTMCLKYKPTVVAAFCIYIACKWSRWEIPNSCEGKAWYTYVDDAVTPDILKKLTDEYLGILEKSPSKFKSKMKTLASNGQAGINQNPSVNARDETVHTPNQKTPHDKQHHHHHHHNSRATGSSSSNSVRKQPGELSASASASATSSSSSKQPQQSASSSAFKNLQPGMSSSSNSHQQRQRPSSSSSSQQAPYPGNTDNSSSSQKAISEERTSHRQIPQETSNYGSSCQPRPIESHSKRLSSSQSTALGMQSSSSSSQPQLNQHQPPHQKPTNNDQRHSQSASSKAPIDYHQKSMKHPQSTTSAEMHARSSSSTHSQSQQQQQQQQPSPQMKKSSWAQQQQQQLQQSTSQPQSNLPKQTQSHVQSSHSQPNLSSSSSSSSRNNSQALPSYSESQKQNASQPSSQNDFWFNDKIHETTAKPISPIRQGKSMFSPSPDHDKETYDKRLLMMTSHVKRNESPKSDKQDRRTTTPNKREKKLEMQAASSVQKSSTQVDRKSIVPKLEPTAVPTLGHDPNGQMKKRPFSAIDEQMSADFGRDSKARKVDIKSEPNHLTGSMMKQPIETNPDIVKSLLQECYTVNKFDSFGGMDSPLDVINTEPTNTPSLTASLQPKTELNDASILKMEPRENGYEEEHHKRNKSKKSKKEKHKHKKKKSHKSDREDREDRKDSSLKIILSVDSKSSPENSQVPRGLKIKIPIKDVNKSELANAQQQQQQQLPPAPLKLKISKEKFGGFNNSGVMSDGSSSSSSHKKKEKDKDKERSKSKSSKHGNNNNIPEYKDVGYHQPQQHQPQQQHQQLSMNKMSSSQVSMPQNHQLQQQNSFDASLNAMFNNQQYQPQVQQPGMYPYPQQHPQQQMMNHPQQQQMMNHTQQSMMNLQQQQFQNYNYQPHPTMNNYSTNGSNSGKK